MKKQEYVIIADYSEDNFVTLDELCEISSLSADDIQHLIEYEIIRPQGRAPGEWVFDEMQLRRLQTAMRLQRDLEVNLAGVVMVLDLLEEMDKLRARADFLEKHLLR